MNLRKTTSSPTRAWDNTFPATGMLQRKCDCGQHTSGGSECSACGKKRDATLQHTGINPGSRHNVNVQSAPTNSFEDCPADWQKKANEALVRGRIWVENVITGLSNLPNPIPPPVAALLNRHFHTTYSGDIKKIVGHFYQIYNAMNASIDFECETDCDARVAAYVYTVWTDLHLCPVWHNQSPNGQTNTIIHELAHDAADRDDEAYIWQSAYATLSVDDAIDNADSYSNFAEEAMNP